MFYKNHKIWLALILLSLDHSLCIQTDASNMAADYFKHKGVKHLVHLSCKKQSKNVNLAKHLMMNITRVAVRAIDAGPHDLKKVLHQWSAPIGVLLDGTCHNIQLVLNKASEDTLFDATHAWMVLTDVRGQHATLAYIDEMFTHLNLSVDADIVVVSTDGYCCAYTFIDVFNFGRIQGNNLEKSFVGTWRRGIGLNIFLKGFKYYDRWDFHNLTLRAVSVILERPKDFHPDMLSDVRYTPGVAAMTKVVGQLFEVLKEQHNFRFKFTIADRWVGAPERNSTLAVTNSMYWREQDISYTCLRIFPKWLDWMDPFFPPASHIETKFYYLMLDRGIGEYENRFIQPLSLGAWACACAAAALSALALCACAAAERRPQPALYALCSVFAAVCQQAYEDGVQTVQNAFSSQGRRVALATAGVASMLLYNYYTSSVVSWLLSAAPPALASLDALAASRLQLVFEDVGYTRGWLDYPGFYYYSGFKNPIEDELRDKKVTKVKRSVPLFQSAADAVELIRSGEYAYHSEPYSASGELARRLDERELCQLAALQMMPPAPTYIVGQKRSPYKQFFDWSLLRLSERGHLTVLSARVRAATPVCSGRTPRALSLGQAAPAFALLGQAALLALVVLAAEILAHRVQNKRR